ncbi:MAG: hypothetical protein ACPF8V_08495 [Luteibaculum sp.]
MGLTFQAYSILSCLSKRFRKHIKFPALLLLIAGVLALSGCQDPRYDKSSQKVQSYRQELNRAREEFEKIDTVELNDVADIVVEAVDSLEKIAVEKKWILEKEEAEYFTNYKSLVRPARQLSEKAQILKSDMLYSEKQLATLLTDIENQALPIDSVMRYVELEAKAVETIAKSTRNMVEGNQVLMARFELLHPQFSYYVNRIEKRK